MNRVVGAESRIIVTVPSEGRVQWDGVRCEIATAAHSHHVVGPAAAGARRAIEMGSAQHLGATRLADGLALIGRPDTRDILVLVYCQSHFREKNFATLFADAS